MSKPLRLGLADSWDKDFLVDPASLVMNETGKCWKRESEVRSSASSEYEDWDLELALGGEAPEGHHTHISTRGMTAPKDGTHTSAFVDANMASLTESLLEYLDGTSRLMQNLA